MVICPKSLIEELDDVTSRRDNIGKLLISGSAHVVFPYHRLLDALEEKIRGNDKIGTTGRGIGPAYQDKVSRIGIRMFEFVDPNRLKPRLEQVLQIKNKYISAFGGDQLDFELLYNEYSKYAERLKPYVCSAEWEINQAIYSNQKVLFEGAQGALLDLDTGTYPYVTSSHPTSSGACLGSGLAPNQVNNVVGVCVAYSTRVGTGPFPTELHDETGEKIRIAGNEFGTTTGRPRRTGWIDLVALRHSARMNGFTSLALTRLDVLTGFEQIGMANSYQLNGEEIQFFPTDTAQLDAVKPNYQFHHGWQEDLANVTSFDSLPENAKSYVRMVEEFVGIPISILSIGPKRSQTLILRPDLLWKNS